MTEFVRTTSLISPRTIWDAIEELLSVSHDAKPAETSKIELQNPISAPQGPEMPEPPLEQARISTSKVVPTVSERAKATSALAQTHERARSGHLRRGEIKRSAS